MTTHPSEPVSALGAVKKQVEEANKHKAELARMGLQGLAELGKRLDEMQRGHVELLQRNEETIAILREKLAPPVAKRPIQMLETEKVAPLEASVRLMFRLMLSRARERHIRAPPGKRSSAGDGPCLQWI